MERAQAAQIWRKRRTARSGLTVEAKLVAINVPRGSACESQSGLNNLFQHVYSRLADDGCDKRLAFIVIHPTSNFVRHYLLEPLQRRGRAIMGLNTRYAANDSTANAWSQCRGARQAPTATPLLRGLHSTRTFGTSRRGGSEASTSLSEAGRLALRKA